MLHPLQKISVTLGGSTKMRVAHISSSGIGILREPRQRAPEVDSVVKGTLTFKDKKFEVRFMIVQVGPMTVECEFVDERNETDGLRGHIHQYLTQELATIELHEVNPQVLKKEPDGSGHLFRAKESCELFYVEKGGHLVRFQLSFFGNYLEGGPGIPIQFGYVHGEDSKDKPSYKGADLIRLISEVPDDVRELAARFISAVSILKPGMRQALVEAIKNSA